MRDWVQKEDARSSFVHIVKPASSYCGCSLLLAVSDRNHSETWAGCIVSLTNPTRSSLTASRSVLSRRVAEKASSVFLASYFLRQKRRSIKDCMRCLKRVNEALLGQSLRAT